MQTCTVGSLFQDNQTSQAMPRHLGAGDTCITDKYYECNAENIFFEICMICCFLWYIWIKTENKALSVVFIKHFVHQPNERPSGLDESHSAKSASRVPVFISDCPLLVEFLPIQHIDLVSEPVGAHFEWLFSFSKSLHKNKN